MSHVVHHIQQLGGYSSDLYLMAHGAVMQPHSSLKQCGIDQSTILQVLAASALPAAN